MINSLFDKANWPNRMTEQESKRIAHKLVSILVQEKLSVQEVIIVLTVLSGIIGKHNSVDKAEKDLAKYEQ